MVGGGMGVGGGMVMMPNGQMAMTAGQMGGGQIMMTPQGQMIQGMFLSFYQFVKNHNIGGVPHQTVSFGHWLKHIRVQHLVLGSITLDCNTSHVKPYKSVAV